MTKKEMMQLPSSELLPEYNKLYKKNKRILLF